MSSNFFDESEQLIFGKDSVVNGDISVDSHAQNATGAGIIANDSDVTSASGAGSNANSGTQALGHSNILQDSNVGQFQSESPGGVQVAPGFGEGGGGVPGVINTGLINHSAVSGGDQHGVAVGDGNQINQAEGPVIGSSFGTGNAHVNNAAFDDVHDGGALGVGGHASNLSDVTADNGSAVSNEGFAFGDQHNHFTENIADHSDNSVFSNEGAQTFAPQNLHESHTHVDTHITGVEDAFDA
jgi:hypothetical protein